MSLGALFSSLLAVVLALVIVLGLAWGAIRLLRYWQDKLQGSAASEEAGRPIRFLRAMPLGQNERVALIEVQDEILLVGVTGGGISLLARWPAGQTATPGRTSSAIDGKSLQ